jgi:hypothetical protein
MRHGRSGQFASQEKVNILDDATHFFVLVDDDNDELIDEKTNGKELNVVGKNKSTKIFKTRCIVVLYSVTSS